MVTRRLTKRGTKRREDILQISHRLFAEQGYHGTTVGEICDALGVGKGVFYWYFDSKEALFLELLQSSLVRLSLAQQSAIEGVQDPRTVLERGIAASIEFFRADPGLLEIIRIAARYEEFSGFVDRAQHIIAADTAGHIKEGMATGAFRGGDAELMAHGILGAIFHFVEVYFGTDGSAPVRPELTADAVGFCMQGILRGSGDSSSS